LFISEAIGFNHPAQGTKGSRETILQNCQGLIPDSVTNRDYEVSIVAVLHPLKPLTADKPFIPA
jgi:hypothetical protein